MLVSRTPFRVSLFGGGTDFESYFVNNPSIIIGSTIDLFVNIFVGAQQKNADQKYKISWRITENADSIDDILHPALRETLRYFNYKDPLNIAIMSDIPGGVGLGGSSSFTVGFINIIAHLSKKKLSKLEVAKLAYKIEREILLESGGVQDQIFASLGGSKILSLYQDSWKVDDFKSNELMNYIFNICGFLVYSGQSRNAHEVEAKKQPEKSKLILDEITSISYQAKKLFLF